MNSLARVREPSPLALVMEARARAAADWVRADLAFFPLRLRIRLLRAVIRRLELAVAAAERAVRREVENHER